MKKLRFFTFLSSLMCACMLVTSCAANKHIVSSSWKMNKDEHWHTCSHCEELFDKSPHEMEITEQFAGDCTTDAYIKHECKVCGYFYKDTTPATGHNLVRTVAVPADCTTSGNTEYFYCDKCHKYFSDENGQNEISENSWVITSTGHTLYKVEAVEATKTNAGNEEYYTCDVCHKMYSDAAGNNEINQIPVIPQLVSSVAESRNANIGDKIVVRGIVSGITATRASLTLNVLITLKDEVSNIMMPLSGGVGDASKLSTATGTASAMNLPWAKGTIVEIPVTVTKTTTTYPNGSIGLKYLKYEDTDDELAAFNKGMAENYAFDLTDESIQVIDNQPDFFKFLGLMNGSNVASSEGFEYNGQVAGSNAFRIVKFVGMQGVKISATDWRPVFGDEYNTWAKTSISNSASATNEIGAHQSFYPSFYMNNSNTNIGGGFEEKIFGDVSGVTLKDWKNHANSIADFYCVFVGGNDYYAQFAILDDSWIIPRV